MNRREFMKAAAAIAGGLGLSSSKTISPPKNYREARDEILVRIIGTELRAVDNASSGFMQVGIVAGGQIGSGSLVYIGDDGLAYPAWSSEERREWEAEVNRIMYRRG